MAFEIVCESQHRLSPSDDSFVARAVLKCSQIAYNRETVISSTSAMFIMAELQLYTMVSTRFPEVSQLDEAGHDVMVSELIRRCRESDNLIGELCSTLHLAKANVQDIVSPFASVFKERSLEHKTVELSLILTSDDEFDWVVVFKEDSIALTSKSLFYLDDESTSLELWSYGVKEPSNVSMYAFESRITDDGYEWWQNYILPYLPFSEYTNDVLHRIEEGEQ
jgi:hypothetical protein